MARPLGRYSMTAIALHWLMAALIGVNLWLGLGLALATGGVAGLPARPGPFAWHAGIGLTLLALAFARIGWRLANPPPPEAPGRAHWQKSAANALHLAFYAWMIGMPLSGWLLATTDPRIPGVHLFHLGVSSGLPLPRMPLPAHISVARRRALASSAASIHRDLAYVALALIGLHMASVLKQQMFDPNPVLARMSPFAKKRAAKP
ncbi:MAG TPA: cytochrome b [Caulobacteraceae bacterium]|nr:cytochrome b [Caulobacteraceae bacterium]